MKIVKRICGCITTLIILLLAIIALLMIVPRFLGYETMAVISGSMEPFIPVGSVVYAKAVDAEDLKEGDVITYEVNEGTRVTHRIASIDKENKQIITKGDANEVEDGAPVEYNQVVGRADYHVPFLGYLTVYIKTPLGIAAICGLAFILILLNFLPDFLQKEDKKAENK